MIIGVGKAMPPELAKWDNPNRPITASGAWLTSKYLNAMFML